MSILPNYDPNDTEAGMKILEDLTENVHQIQQRVLEEILTRNANTEYLKCFFNGHNFDNELFKKKVPMVSYEDIKTYIERIANGDSSNIISAEPITELLTRCASFLFLFRSENSVSFLEFFLNVNLYICFDVALARPVGSQR